MSTLDDKQRGELKYWTSRKEDEGELGNQHYERYYTTHFGLTLDDYTGKNVVDIGCGPRGSLEWATTAKERVGIDPLADEYLKLGASSHAMTYVASGAEQIPFPDGHFDIVCSFNSIDHVDDLDDVVAEIKRITAPGGLFLLLTDVHDEPTPQEPVCFDWDDVYRFTPEFALQSLHCYEKVGGGLYQAITQDVPFDHSDLTKRYGVVSARFVRMPAAVEPEPVP